MNDGRLVSGSSDNSIIIYNKTTYQPDIIIKEHSSYVSCVTQLSSGVLASCSLDKTVKLFNIKGVEYEIIQTLNYHTNTIYKIVELKNKSLASCSDDSSILFYFKDNNEYQKDYKISTNGPCYSIIQTKDNEICYSEYTNSTICFFDLLERKIKTSISNISIYHGTREWFIMISKDLLLIPGDSKISIVNVNHYNIARIIDVPGSSYITGVCMISQNILITGDYAEIIRQWRIEGDNLILISKKEKTHDHDINCMLNIGNGYIASGSSDYSIKIW
jgi:WD40 repeat protein